MNRLRTSLLVLIVAPVLAVPSSASAQATTGPGNFTPDPDLRIVAPAPFAPCYSPTRVFRSAKDRATIPSISLTGGEPGARFVLMSNTNPAGTSLDGNNLHRFDANGNATVVDFVLFGYSASAPSPGEKIDLTVMTLAEGSFPVSASQTPVGSFTGTGAYGLEVRGGGSVARAGQKKSLSVSGVPLANRTLYLFLTDARSGKQISRVKLGRADQCGYFKGQAVLRPKGYEGRLPIGYVNAGPKLDKRKALSTNSN